MMEKQAPRMAALGHQDADAVLAIDQWAFAFDLEGVDLEPILAELEWDRTYGAHLPSDDGSGGESLVGINSTFTLQLPVPGGSVPCAGLTWVGVHPQYRRRGVLTAMMRDHLARVREGDEPVSALHASEAAIYGRFGYGAASRHVSMTLSRGASLRDVPGSGDVRVRFDHADVDRYADVVGDCYEAARQQRPGMVSRDTTAHRRKALDDQKLHRQGAESLRILLAEADGGGPARGYALFRRKTSSAGSLPSGTVTLRELVARDAAAAHALWSRLIDLDLMSTVVTDERPLDDPLLFLLDDPRAAGPAVVDGLYVRLVDLPAALTARSYAGDIDVVLEVTDALLPSNAGRWRLKGGPDGASCAATRDTADLALDVRELGAAYLGSSTLTGMAAAGLVHTRDSASLLRASSAFSWPVASFCGWRF